MKVPQEAKSIQIMSVCHPLLLWLRVSRWDPLQGTMCVVCHCPKLWHGVHTIPSSFLSFQLFLQQLQNLVLPTKLKISLSKEIFLVSCFGAEGGAGMEEGGEEQCWGWEKSGHKCKDRSKRGLIKDICCLLTLYFFEYYSHDIFLNIICI